MGITTMILFAFPASAIQSTETTPRIQRFPRMPVQVPGKVESDSKQRHIPGRFIVKFAETLSEPADTIHDRHRSFSAATPANGEELDRLHQKYKIKSVKPLFSHILEEPAKASQVKQPLGHRKQLLSERIGIAKAKYQRRTARAAQREAIPDLTSIYVYETSEDVDVPAICREYASNPNVIYAVPVQVASAQLVPNDPYYSSSGSWGNLFNDLWGLKKIGAETAWDTTGGQGIVVAVVDTGLDYNHPDIVGNVWLNTAEANGNPTVDDDNNGFIDDVRGWNFSAGNNNPADRYGHGTHVAGTIAAVGDNSIGLIGVAYQARVMPVKGLGDSGNGGLDDLANAIVYAAINGADIINNSWGCWGCSADPAIEDAITTAHSLGSIVVFASGNDSSDAKYSYPANIQEVVTVGSTGVDDSLSSFSNWGRMVDVVAPGGGPQDNPLIPDSLYNILSLRASGTGSPDYAVGDVYTRMAGTSMATPHVSGVAALLLAANPALTRNEIVSILRHSSDDMVGKADLDLPGFDPVYGWGRLNAARALSMASTPPSDPAILDIPASQLSYNLPYSQCGESRALPLDIYNIGGGTLNWSAVPPSWLSVVPTTGKARASVKATTSTTSSQQGILAIDSVEASNGRQDITVAATVYPDVRIDQCSTILSQSEGKQEWAPLWNVNVPGVSDGQGGAIYVWGSAVNNPNLAVQRIDSNGRPMWQVNGKPLTSAPPPAASIRPAIAPDGAGGAIIVWMEGINDNNMSPEEKANKHLRGQRVSPAGDYLWGPEGIYVSQAAGGQEEPRVAPDGSGGVVVSWIDYRHGSPAVYTQRVSGSGQLLWEADGVRAAVSSGNQINLSMATDGSGGIFVTWMDMRRNNYWDIYAQHLNGAGRPVWAVEGLLLSTEEKSVAGPKVVPDGAGGAIFAWHDFRNFPLSPSGATVLDRSDIYAVKMSGEGQYLWQPGGVPVVTGLTAAPKRWVPGWGPDEVSMVADGAGGIIAVWHDARDPNWWDKGWNIYAQRINSSGEPVWPANGVPVSDALDNQIAPSVTPDGAGGGIFIWTDGRSGQYDISMQHVTAAGVPQWGTDGLWVQSAPGDQMYPHLVPLAGNRYALTWDDWRNYIDGYMTGTGLDILGKTIQLCSDVDGNGYYDEGGVCGPVNPSDNELAVTIAGTGRGTVTSTPAGIVCGAECRGYFYQGTEVTLTATPDPSSLFTGWHGACTGTGNCTVTMNGDQQVTATFTRKPTIEYSRLGSGSGTVTFSPGETCGDNCSPYYAAGTSVALTATPDAGSVFAGWRGACAGAGSCTLTMDADKVVAAQFLPTGSRVPAISAGASHTVAMTGNGVLWSWGENSSGQLGNGMKTYTPQTTPVRSPALAGAVVVTTGTSADHSAALLADSSVWTWGRGGNKQLGYPASFNPIPQQVPGLPIMAAVAAGSNHTMTVTAAGDLWSWGENSDGQLGDDTTASRNEAFKVAGLTNITAASGGGYHSVALKSDGTVWTWGANYFGQLGDGTATQRSTPVQVPGLEEIVAIAGGGYYTLALKSDGSIWSWGNNWYGQLGDGTTTERRSPVQVQGLSGVVAISAGYNHAVALKGDGTVWAWGYNGSGQLGDGTTASRRSPVQVPGLSRVVSIAAGTRSSFASIGDDTLWAWGENGSGQLGDGTTDDRYSPVPILFDTIAPTTTASPGGGTYDSVQQVVLSTNETSTIYYTLDGSTPTTGSPVYNGPITVSASTTILKYFARDTAGNSEAVRSESYNITAHSLSVVFQGAGNGTVSFSTGDSCTAYCTRRLPSGTTAVLTATPAAGSTFGGWTGGGCSGTSVCTVTLDDDVVITALLDLPPAADFSASITSGNAPLTVKFTDLSTGMPVSWLWDFGDSSTSTDRNPTHTYSYPGSYAVSLKVDNLAGSSTISRGGYINAANPGPSPIQPIYNAAADGALIRLRSGVLNESPNLNRSIAVTIAGGYDYAYQAVTGVTVFKGIFTVSKGTATVENLVLQ